MDANLVLLLYLILSAVFVLFLILMFLYLFNKNVLSKWNLSLKITAYISVYTISLIFGVNYVLTNYPVEKNFFSKQKIFLVGLVICYILIVFATLYINLYPIKKIINTTQNLVSNKELKEDLIYGSREFDNIQTNLDGIKNSFKENDDYNIKLKKEYYKFIPKEFYDYLGKKDVFELKLGENVQKDVCVLFVDIRHSYRTSETLSLDDNFKFINSYLCVVGECVKENRGFIDKFLGDGVLAVFLNERDAVSCSVELSKRFENINLVSIGEDKIRYGIGIHSGKVIIGIVGEKDRLSPTIISDSVNLAYKIESLNKIFLSKILFTKEVLNNLPREFEINYRYVGLVKIDDVSVSLFENLDAYYGVDKQLYIKTKSFFETAVRNYEDKNYKNAKKYFLKVLEINEEDNLAKFYLKKCKIV